MFQIIKMIIYRILHNLVFLFLPLIVTPIVIALSLFFTHNMSVNANIAIVGECDIDFSNIDAIKVTYLESEPKISELLQGKYDAAITVTDGKFEITTIKGEQFRNALDELLEGETPEWNYGQVRGEVANLVGFIMMFVLLLGVMLYRFYYEEKGGIDRRILSTKINYLGYCLSHCIVVFCMVFIPIIAVILIFSWIHGFNSNVSNYQIILIIGTISLLGATYGFFISSLIESDESAILLGAMTIIISTLISGSFRNTVNNPIIEYISHMLPQKQILDYVIALEGDQFLPAHLIVCILFSIAFVMLGLYFNKRRLAYNR